MDTGAYALSFARYFLTSQPNEILSPAKPTVDEQSGVILKNLDNFTRPDKAVITYANGKTEEIEEGETAKGLNYEVEDMQAAVLHQTGSQTISLSPECHEHLGQCQRTVGHYLPV
ncbi:hypothetical protein [Bacillus mojavensis]|uniref:hypothetical protein n=1 Tax=Bacillus mojavensis TaxID=72360 RepID=UPI002281D6AC|nr:hypothetical protein [Bacillus mojavensis]MCY8105753.1 hypothetical protein [Bacillus mojavensis]MCY8482336.1 hypothetical protein [Bacillus mojavensis]